MTATFYLGTHHPDWLARAGVPLFVSHRALVKRRTFPRAVAPWALDSGGFTELKLHGRWMTSAAQYAADVRRFRDEVGMMDWAAPQDWMCEPDEILPRTGLSVAEHQQRTIANYLELRALAPDLPFVPVLQGWGLADYWRHVEQYQAAGVELDQLPLVGVGTVCRRQKTSIAQLVMSTLSAEGLRLHGFGFKLTGLRKAAQHLVSADSMAWSVNGRWNPAQRIAGHTHKSCANCIEWALSWREDAIASIGAAL